MICCRCPAYWDRYHVLYNNKAEDPVLHSQLDITHGADQLPLCASFLFTCRGGWESDTGYQYFAFPGCVPPVGLKNSAPNLTCTPSYCKVSLVHLYYEHCQYSRYGDHHQLELQRSQNSLNAQLDQSSVHQIFANISLYEATKEDSVTMDDGDARRSLQHKTSSSSNQRVSWVSGEEDGSWSWSLLSTSSRTSKTFVTRSLTGAYSRTNEK